jgi:hypothetical protein
MIELGTPQLLATASNSASRSSADCDLYVGNRRDFDTRINTNNDHKHDIGSNRCHLNGHHCNPMSNEIFLDGAAYISARDAARETGLSRDYLSKLAKAGKTTATWRELLRATPPVEDNKQPVYQASPPAFGSTRMLSVETEVLQIRRPPRTPCRLQVSSFIQTQGNQ